MIKLGFGEERPQSKGKYFRVKEKGDTITFRIAQEPVYTGQHFFRNGDGWDVPECPRINGGGDCEHCEKFFEAKALEKKAKEAKDSEAEKEASSIARHFSPSVTYYFPVLNRLTEEFVVLQTTEGVRNKINELFLAGTKVMERDLTLTNTGKEKKDKYAVAVVDSSDSKEFTDKEKEEFEKAKEYDTSSINTGKGAQDESETFNVPEATDTVTEEDYKA